jgi:cell division protein FtsQ
LATSKKREAVFISTAQRDRAAARRAAANAEKRGRPTHSPKPKSDARALAEARRAERDGRIAVRRRTTRLRTVAIVAAVAVVVVACAWVYNSELFRITSVEVVGTEHVSREAVLALAAVPSDATLLRFPADEVAARVSADPWVASVAVSRVFPSGMRIRVTERVPIAVVDARSSFMLVDGQGMVIATATVGATATVPVIENAPGLDLKPGRKTVSEPLLNALAILTGISRELAAMVVSVDAATMDGATLTTSSRVEIVIGQADDSSNPLATKDALARSILAAQQGKVVGIDVRLVDRPTSHGLPK